MRPISMYFSYLIYLTSLAYIIGQEITNRQGVFQTSNFDPKLESQVDNIYSEINEGSNILLKHILHIGDPESHVEVSSKYGKTQFQQWDNIDEDDIDISSGFDLNFKALDKLYQTKGDFSILNAKSDPDSREVRKAILTLGKMAGHAYKPLPKKPWKDIDPDWKVEEGFGWNQKRVRGYVFTDKDRKNLVISFKGTTFTFLPGNGDGSTGPSDKESDNLMFSCCCGATSANWEQVCSCNRESHKCNSKCLNDHAIANTTYYHGALMIFDKVVKENPYSNIVLVGHSLGGSLASLVGLTRGVPAITFEAPGDRLYARRLGLNLNFDHKKSPFIFHFGNNADPIFLGTCNGLLSLCYIGGYGMDSKCHTFNKCSFDVKESLGWTESIFHHRITQVITHVLEDWADNPNDIKLDCWSKSNCTDCTDWDFI